MNRLFACPNSSQAAHFAGSELSQSLSFRTSIVFWEEVHEAGRTNMDSVHFRERPVEPIDRAKENTLRMLEEWFWSVRIQNGMDGLPSRQLPTWLCTTNCIARNANNSLSNRAIFCGISQINNCSRNRRTNYCACYIGKKIYV